MNLGNPFFKQRVFVIINSTRKAQIFCLHFRSQTSQQTYSVEKAQLDVLHENKGHLPIRLIHVFYHDQNKAEDHVSFLQNKH